MNRPRFEGLRVLLIDDDLDTRDLFTFILQTEAAEVAEAASVQEALAAMKEFVPDIILSDMHLPDGDGFTLVRQLRNLLEQKESTPIIAVTAFAGEEARLYALSAGFQEHLSKPVNPDDLIAAIATLSQRSTRVNQELL
jgi:CheY-like chemotaxis protein